MLIVRNIFLTYFLLSTTLFAQTGWTWTELDTMPFRISNNAVAGATLLGEPHVYSFCGIDTTKIYSGISNRAFRFNYITDTWDEIANTPNTLPLIAAAASTVKNKIYIIGGYHVYSNGSETSSNEVIIYNPELNIYESNGAAVPVPIDDQAQCVWRDSLIYVISGWSNTTNVTNVQIYNPALNSWAVGTPVPNLTTYKVFGSSGFILGDTIFYFGGASTGFNFPAGKVLRKGIINASDPTQITWSIEDDAPNNNYRSACLNYANSVYWVGGSATSYNYNGIAYNGSGGVAAMQQIMRYDAYTQTWFARTGAPFSVMDLRGVAQVGPTSWVICGGMKENQEVSNRTFLLEFDPIVGAIADNDDFTFQVIHRQIILNEIADEILVYSVDAKLLQRVDVHQPVIDSEIFGPVLVAVKVGEKWSTEKIRLP